MPKRARIKLAVIGVGVMGSAILQAVLHHKIFAAKNLLAVDCDAKRLRRFATQGLHVSSEITAAQESELILLALKPQHLEGACQNFQTKAPILSIVAGVASQKIAQLTGTKLVVRAMPNTPAQIGAGVTGIFWPKGLATSVKSQIQKIIRVLGIAVKVKKEKDLAAVTALAGSGPAYFFAFAESLIQAGRDLGLPKEMATVLVRATFCGSAKLGEAAAGSLATLRQQVTSKGGTTAAALAEFEKNNFQRVVTRSVRAAFKRAARLS